MDVAEKFKFRNSCESSITKHNIDTLIELSFMELWTFTDNLKIHINSIGVYQYFIDTAIELDVVKLTFITASVDVRYAKDIIYQLDVDTVITLMGNYVKELRYIDRAMKMWTYVDLISICLNRLLVFHKMGFEAPVSELFNVVIPANIKELNPWLYRNLNEVFDIEREILKRKLIDG